MRALIRFGKRSRLRFISHLDLQRFFQRALNRSGLPIAYTQGFNPHPVLSFGSALALGYTSDYEVLDFKFSVPMGKARTMEALSAALPPDLPVLEVRLVDDRHPAPMAQVRATEYLITPYEAGTGAGVFAAADAFMAMDTVMGIRKTKKGEREINIRPLVLRMAHEGDGLRVLLTLNETDSLKPDVLIKALAEIAGEEPCEVRVHRTLLLGENAEGLLTPLMEL